MDLPTAWFYANLFCGFLTGLASVFMLFGAIDGFEKDPWRFARRWMVAAMALLAVCAIRIGQIHMHNQQLDGLNSEVRELRKLAEELPSANR